MKKKLLLILLCANVVAASVFAQQHTFEIKGGSFLYNGKSIQIHSGEMHYSRVPHEYWRNRLQMIKAMGMNTVTTYVFWNFHETAPGVWNFSGDRDLAKFIKTAQDVGLFVILRPGPYICAEWDFGGYPWWLQKVQGLEIRTYNQPFLDSCNTYFQQLANQIKGLQITQGGNIIMVQVENEFGSYVAQRNDISSEQHKKYLSAIKKELLQNGFDVPLFTADATSLFDGGSVVGALPCGNGENNVDTLKKYVNFYHNGEGPYLVSEFYPGWLVHWGEKFARVSTQSVVNQTEKYLKAGVSFSFYMIFGGTNFGFTSGANYSKEHDIQPDLTSYDYDAPISEAGWATPKFWALRNLMKNYVADIPEAPKPAPTIAINEIQLTKTVDLFKNIIKKILPVICDTPLSFENLNQGFGYVLYRKKITQAMRGTLAVKGLRDYALVYVNGKKIGELNRQMNKYALDVDLPTNATLDILVENMGRINYGAEITQNLKGIISPVFINDEKIIGAWQMYGLPMNTAPEVSENSFENSCTPGNPAVYRGEFSLEKIGDTFIDMENWGKGIVFVNGYNLGRYWKIGAQQTLYLPGCRLKKGKNVIEIFEQQNDICHKTIHTVSTPVLDKLNL